jgi:hypothetical protein
MKRLFSTAVAGAIGLLVASTAAQANDYTQLIRSAGLTPSEAQGMTLDEIAAHKFSRHGGDNRQEVVRPSAQAASFQFASRRGPDLDQTYVRMINRSSNGDDRQAVLDGYSGSADSAARRQLAASAGLTPDEAATMSLGALSAHKMNRGTRRDDWIPVRD